jgi:hypothetical protein
MRLLAVLGFVSLATPAHSANCAPETGTFFSAQLRGEIHSNLDLRGKELRCEGGSRPDGRGLRLSFAGVLPKTRGQTARPIRIVLGIDLKDQAPGRATALPTNVTVIFEGEKLLFATRGSQRCAVEDLVRRPLLAGKPGREHIAARGYCLQPATDVSGTRRLLLPTFEFAGVIDLGSGV